MFSFSKLALVFLSIGSATIGGYLTSISLKNNSLAKKKINILERKDSESQILSSIFQVKKDNRNSFYDYSFGEVEENLQDISNLEVVAEYIQKDNEEFEKSLRGPLCKQWFKGKKAGKDLEKEKCKALVEEKFGKEGKKLEQPSFWVSTSKEKAQQVLKEYWLLSENSILSTEKENSWVEDFLMCTSKQDLKDSNKLLITCEYLLESEEGR